jgi:hypothetical protein
MYLFSVQRLKTGIYSTYIVKERPTAISSGATCGFNDLKHPIAATYGAFLRTLNKYQFLLERLFL